MNHSQHDDYYDRSDDLIARVHRAKEAAQRKMEEFGDPSEYDITIIQGEGPEDEPPTSTTEEVSQPSDPLSAPDEGEQIELQTTVKLIESDPQSPIEEE